MPALIPEKLPRVGKIMPEVEEAPAVAGQTSSRAFEGFAPQHLAPFACGVIKVENEVGDGVEIEVVVLRRQFDAPAAHRPEKFERQIALVVKIELQ
jgi:hypothetical protein